MKRHRHVVAHVVCALCDCLFTLHAFSHGYDLTTPTEETVSCRFHAAGMLCLEAYAACWAGGVLWCIKIMQDLQPTRLLYIFKTWLWWAWSWSSKNNNTQIPVRVLGSPGRVVSSKSRVLSSILAFQNLEPNLTLCAYVRQCANVPSIFK